jgi:hypothetical protein
VPLIYVLSSEEGTEFYMNTKMGKIVDILSSKTHNILAA